MGKCPWCRKPMRNAGDDPSQPPTWECLDPQCINSVEHKDVVCPTCGKRPAELLDGCLSHTDFQCDDGHFFRAHAHGGIVAINSHM